MKWNDKILFRFMSATFSLFILAETFYPGTSIREHFETIPYQYHPWLLCALVFFFGWFILSLVKFTEKGTPKALDFFGGKYDTAKEEVYVSLGTIRKLYIGNNLYRAVFVLGIVSIVFIAFDSTGHFFYIPIPPLWTGGQEYKLPCGTLLIAFWIIWAFAAVLGDSIHKSGTFVRYKHDDLFDKK